MKPLGDMAIFAFANKGSLIPRSEMGRGRLHMLRKKPVSYQGIAPAIQQLSQNQSRL
jgi:hypothetical protein